MAKFTETTLTIDDIKQSIAAKLDCEVTDINDLELKENAQDVLDTEFEGYPAILYFRDIKGQAIILELADARYGSNVITGVAEVADDESVAESYLRDTIGYWDGDDKENLALYDLSPVFDAPINNDAKNVRIWVTRHYHSKLGAPMDGYLKDTAGEQQTFDTVDDATAWIAKQESTSYVLDHNEYSPPTYTVVA